MGKRKFQEELHLIFFTLDSKWYHEYFFSLSEYVKNLKRASRHLDIWKKTVKNKYQSYRIFILSKMERTSVRSNVIKLKSSIISITCLWSNPTEI